MSNTAICTAIVAVSPNFKCVTAKTNALKRDGSVVALRNPFRQCALEKGKTPFTRTELYESDLPNPQTEIKCLATPHLL